MISLLLFLMPSQESFAQIHRELTTSLSVSEGYDFNIDLDDSEDERSSYVTFVTPSMTFNFLSQNTQLGLTYTPTFVWYSENDVDDTVGHSATLVYGQDLSEQLRIDLTDNFLLSDDPLEDIQDVEGWRDTREQYWINTVNASLRYLFGQENTLTTSYSNGYQKNDNDEDDDSRTQNLSTTMTYLVDVRNSIGVNYGYTIADFWNDDNSPDGSSAGDDYTGHTAGLRYIYSFTPFTSANLAYNFTAHRFEGLEEDYKVHDGSIGFDQAFSPEFSASASAGYFVQKNDRSNDETGYTYSVSLIREFERGSISTNGDGGWNESYLSSDTRGFGRYWGASTSVEYQILEFLTGYAAGSFRHNKDKGEDDQKWDTYRGNCGLGWNFLRWFTLSLDYSYAERNGDQENDNYRVNRVMLVLSASKLYRW